jgi:hypothetical protein
VKLTLLPAATAWFAGFVVTVGAEFAGPGPVPEPLDPQPTRIRQTPRAKIAKETLAMRLTDLELGSISTTSY